MEPKLLRVLGIVLVMGGLCETEGCSEHERIALLHLKSFFNDPYNLLPNWEDVKGSDCCEWKMVNCSITSRRVIQLSLNYTRVQYGYLNASLFLPFTELKTLNLMGTRLYGFVDNQGFRKVASALRKLEIIDLSKNYLNDSILTSLSELSSLKSLYLANNTFTGSDDINGFAKLCSALKNLEVLDLSGNYFNDTILTWLSELSSLKSLYLANNKFTGSDYIDGFEKLCSALKNLEVLDLSGNYFNDTILTSLSELSSLKSLYLEANIFTGSKQTNGIAKLSSALKKLEILDLSETYLSESIISSLSELSSLKSLNLAGNRFIGSNGFKWLSRLNNLKTLDLSGNELKNNFLLHVGGLSSLETLNLAVNQFKGSVNMTELNRMRKLRNLDLHGNAIESFGSIQGWCDLWNLEELYLGGNSLEGSIPPCFHNLTSLRLLDISNNHIEVLPSFISLANNSRLKFLFIGQNSLVRDSTFQAQTKNPKFQLKLLSMSNCSTKGLIPKELPNFLYEQYDLRYVDLSYNNFGGENPAWLLENNTRLQQFILAGNSFKGLLQLPKQANVHMFEVDMSGNKMQGQIPMNICSTFPHLSGLFLSRNAFDGNIPSCLGGLEILYWLDLSYNKFSGGILEELGKSDSLGNLRLSNNNLSGNIPPALFSSSAMYGLYLDGNNFDGEIPQIDTSNVSFSYLRNIDLSNNHLSGKLPRWIWNLSLLHTLVLSNNHFDADLIPLELCNLVLLRFLDLSQNNFSGSVPSCFSSLNILEHLHLSRNKLSGPLPRALDGSSSLVTLDLSQNNLTGKIPKWVNTLSALRILLLKANKFEGEIPSEICRLNSLSIVITFFRTSRRFGRLKQSRHQSFGTVDWVP